MIIDSQINIHAGSTIFPIGLLWFDLYQLISEFSTGYKVIDLHQLFNALAGVWLVLCGAIYGVSVTGKNAGNGHCRVASKKCI